MNNASKFKSDINKLTEFRIRQIVQYVIYCYLKILDDKITYNYSEKGKISKEDFLKYGLVNDYLQKRDNKRYFIEHISDNPSVDVDISFHPEETMIYNDNGTDKKTVDKIDIAVHEDGLQSIWSEKTEDEIRFAIECKRIEKLSDTDNYISDIENFSIREYEKTRLPFEGQIAFIENKSINYVTLKNKINEILKNHHSIITDSFLNPIVLDDKFDGTYLSKHQRTVSRHRFSIYHLLFNYSNIVVD
jgi:hypothetical protein